MEGRNQKAFNFPIIGIEFWTAKSFFLGVPNLGAEVWMAESFKLLAFQINVEV